ncbi:MAG: hypothetical protein GIX02_11680 [Candidatus Eremiobacteraeota bacterium]|nr:hypothetical protein [Candidatus Eremiobacteraeota bacterium]
MQDKNGSTQVAPSIQTLPEPTSIVLATVDRGGIPSTAIVSWVVARPSGIVALALDRRSSSYRNITSGSDKVACEVLGDDTIFSVRGIARVEKDLMTNAPFPCALVTIEISELRDHSVKGVHFHGPRYLFAGDKRHRRGIQAAVLAELSAS